ncbi:hypothetical protein EV421DRAFT_1743825 [Armillaria borealis]|uniref:Uncharacterized protein n=1 Tax=Armillaria borealis TaxID=47425 RepID=A0AA39IXE2_9AGAR|nr:hypothetical protein EV421DRAFT_1743825 [Armillaria borealis]
MALMPSSTAMTPQYDYSYRSEIPIPIPSYVHPSSLSTETDLHCRLVVLSEVLCRAPPAPTKRSFAATDLCSACPLPLLTDWFRKDTKISSSVFSAETRGTSKRFKVELDQAGSRTTLTSLSVASDNGQKEFTSVRNRPIEEEAAIRPGRYGFSPPSDLNHYLDVADSYPHKTNRAIVPLPKRAHTSNSDNVAHLTSSFLGSLVYPGQFPGSKTKKNNAERLHFLRQDRWIQQGSIQPQRVVCGGCKATLQLESRETSAASGKPAAYYSDPWLKHRNGMRAQRRKRARTAAVPMSQSELKKISLSQKYYVPLS